MSKELTTTTEDKKREIFDTRTVVKTLENLMTKVTEQDCAKGKDDYLLKNMETGDEWFLSEQEVSFLRTDIESLLRSPPVNDMAESVLQ